MRWSKVVQHISPRRECESGDRVDQLRWSSEVVHSCQLLFVVFGIPD